MTVRVGDEIDGVVPVCTLDATAPMKAITELLGRPALRTLTLMSLSALILSGAIAQDRTEQWSQVRSQLANKLKDFQFYPLYPDRTNDPIEPLLHGDFYFGRTSREFTITLPAWEYRDPQSGSKHVTSSGTHKGKFMAVNVIFKTLPISRGDTFENVVLRTTRATRQATEATPMRLDFKRKQGHTISDDTALVSRELTVHTVDYSGIEGKRLTVRTTGAAPGLVGYLKQRSGWAMGSPLTYFHPVYALSPQNTGVMRHHAMFPYTVGSDTYLVSLTVDNHGIKESRPEIPFPDTAVVDKFISTVASVLQQVFDGKPAELQEPDDCGKEGQLTRYLEKLRNHRSILAALEQDLDILFRDTALSRTMKKEFGERLHRRGTDFYQTLVVFQRAETRRGLYEELELISACAFHLNLAISKYHTLVGVERDLSAPEQRRQIQSQAMRKAIELTQMNIASRLESEGLRDIVTSESWDEVMEKATYHAGRKVDEIVDREVEKVFGLGFHDARSAQRAIQLQMRNEVRRQVAKLLVKITTNEIIIELAAAPIIRWIERDLIPHLREALRNKGNLDARVLRSKETLEHARRILFALPCTARLSEVEHAMGMARGIIHETHFLMGDLQSANRMSGYAEMSDAIGNVQRALFITSNRFLLEKPDYEEELDYVVTEVRKMLDELEEIELPQEAENRVSAGAGNAIIPPEERTFKYEGEGFAQDYNLGDDLEGEIESVGSTVSSFRFYEGGFDQIPQNERQYGKRFSSADARAIWWEIELQHAPTPHDRQFTIVTAWWKIGSYAFSTSTTLQTRIPANSTTSTHTSGYGWREPGNWEPGLYRVDFHIDGKKVIHAHFVITE